MGWVATLVSALAAAVVVVLKGLFGTSKPQETTVTHPKPQVEVGDGKADSEKLKDLGL